ncbi:MAG TPA: SMC-Scp complex subunit ScpB [Acidisarcina sp.]
MSLKAKIEAVIYAAEEPVTLAQLAFLFGGEVLAAAHAGDAADAAPALSEEVPAGSALESPDLDSPEQPLRPEAVDPKPSAQDFNTGGQGAPPDAVDAVTLRDNLPGAVETESAATDTATSDADAVGNLTPERDVAAPAFDDRKAGRLRDRMVRNGLRQIVAELIEEYAGSDRGMEIREIAGGYRVATKPEYHDAVRSFVKSLKPPMKLSLQALETLAVIAYKQPVTAPEVNEIRGVDSGGVLGSLMSRKLITTAGRKQVIGRPILYKTTKEFLLRFGLRDVNELPSIEEFEKMAGEMEIEDLGGAELQRSAQLPFEADLNHGASEGIEAADVQGMSTGLDRRPAVSLAGSTDLSTARTSDSEAVEANAGEAGVAISIPTQSSSDGAPPMPLVEGESAPTMVELDSHLAEETELNSG